MNTSPSVRGLFIVGGLAAAIACVGVVHGQITFTGLGPSIFLATDVTNDGSAVVGLGATAGYRWTKSTGAVALPGLSGSGYTSTSPMAISSNGTTVGLTAYGSTMHAARWTQATGTVDLGVLPGGEWSNVDGMSGDGSTVVGTVLFHPDQNTYYYRAFRSTAGGLQNLGTLGGQHSEGRTASQDGSVVLGSSTLASGREQAFLWTEAGGMKSLGTLGNGDSLGLGMSSDAAIAVGVVNFANGSEAFRWTESEGMVGLGQVYGSHASVARGVSDDGSVIVGDKNGGDGGGFIWTPASGMRDFREVLADDYGLQSQLVGWNMLSPFALSPNGRFVVGFGYHGSTRDGWLLDRGVNPPPLDPAGPPPISTVPEPSTYGLIAASALAGVVLLRRRGSIRAT